MGSLRLEIRLLALPTAAALVSARQPEAEPNRLLTVVGLEDDQGRRGWGECAALNRPGYTPEWAEGAFEVLRSAPELEEPGGAIGLLATAPMAMAALEMAEYDLRLTEQGVSLARFVGTERTSVPAGAAIPLAGISDTVRAAENLARLGFRRIKIKVAPSSRSGFRPAVLAASVRTAVPGVEVHLDANGSFTAADAAEIHELAGTVVEQPFPPDESQLAAAAVADGVVVLADEAATSLVAIERLVELDACAGVVVKPPRLGGIFAAFETLGWCSEHGVPATAGGMLESGLGRRALAVVAASDACTITGDLSPARRWLAADPWPDLEMDGTGMITVPSDPGVAPGPDPEVLAEHTVKTAVRKVVLHDR